LLWFIIESTTGHHKQDKMLNFVASVKLVYFPLIQKEYAGKYKMVMQGSQQGTVVTKIEIVKTKGDIQVEACKHVLIMLIFCYCTPALCLSCISAKGTNALLGTKKFVNDCENH
jgi:hypothetical protein